MYIDKVFHVKPEYYFNTCSLPSLVIYFFDSKDQQRSKRKSVPQRHKQKKDFKCVDPFFVDLLVPVPGPGPSTWT